MKAAATAILAISILSCGSSIAQEPKALPQAIVYKTKGNYRNLVPVTLSDDRSRIVSYPAIEDIKGNEKHAVPSRLAKGYLLDNDGRINRHVAFLKLSFEQYGKLSEVPSLAGLYTMLEDKDPLVELYDCGLNGMGTSEKKFKRLIRKHQLGSGCKSID